MKTKKILFGLGAALSSTAILASVVSCSTGESKKEIQISGVEPIAEKYNDKIKSAIDNFSKGQKAVLITAGGTVRDASFNQSIWQGMQIFQDQIKKIDSSIPNFVSYYETTQDGQLNNAYTQSLNNGNKIWVLTGFQQGEKIEAFLNGSGILEKMINQEIKLVGVDWQVNEAKQPNLKKLFDAGKIISINFKTDEPSYVLGYSLSQYLTETFTDPKDWTINSFGGGTQPGVTAFNNGLLNGMKTWNTENPTKKVKFVSGKAKISGTPNDTINLQSGFDPSNENAKNAINEAIDSNAKAFFPVAGSLTNTLLTRIKPGKMMVGVDSDQALSLPNYSNFFFSSAEKKVGVGVYESLIKMLFSPTTKILEETNPLSAFVFGTTSVNVDGGYDLQWVNTSKNIFNDKTQSTKINEIITTATKKFYGQGVTKPNFERVTGANDQEILNKLVGEINTTA